MVAAISPDPRLQFFANDGSPLVGGKLYTYAAGTTTPLATYTSSSGATPNTNPVILDSRGEASVWLGTAKYKFVLKDASDVEIWSQDNVQAAANADGSNATGTWPIDISGNAATATTATYATTAGSVTGGSISSINGAGLYGFTLTGGPITTSGTLTVTPPAPGTSGNVLTSNGTVWVSQAASGAVNSVNGFTGTVQSVVVQGTAVASTSGTSIDFTGIPSWVKRITVNFSEVSTNGTSVVQIQLGTSSGPTITGYASGAFSYNTGNASTSTTGLVVDQYTAATNVRCGSIVISTLGSNIWASQGILIMTATGSVTPSAGGVTLGAVLDRIRITTVNGTDTFDAGSINIFYE